VLSRVLRTIEEHDLVQAGDRVLVGVSGGPDSLALLHALVRLAARLQIVVEAATVDHGLRATSASEAEAVKRHCEGLGVPCDVLRVDVSVHRGRHVSLQDAARRARLGALQEAAEVRGCAHVALAHTADDQAETVLFRIVRGTGVRGLAGIPFQRDKFIRPLLEVRRKEVLRFLGKLRVSFVDDPSNQDPRHARSRIRSSWLPFLAKENPRVVEALLELAEDARRARAEDAQRPPAEDEQSADVLRGLPRDTRRKLRRLVAAPEGTHLIDSSGGLIVVAYGRIGVHFGVRSRDEKHGGSATGHGDDEEDRRLAVGARLSWSFHQERIGTEDHSTSEREIEATLQQGAAGPPPGSATFAAEIAVNGFRVRRFRHGDRMRPRGGRGSRKLQDLFVDAKIPRFVRGNLPIVTDAAGTILYVPGLRPAEDGRPPEGAQRWIEIRVR
jgi:tRNA(Ile)-lysidine synthase